MNLPNKLTIARVIMIPLFLICLYLNIGCGKYIAVGIFILASLTDLLDGLQESIILLLTSENLWIHLQISF